MMPAQSNKIPSIRVYSINFNMNRILIQIKEIREFLKTYNLNYPIIVSRICEQIHLEQNEQ